jgi:hypothetical protein
MSTRKVHRSGWIKHEGQTIFVSQALGGWDVGLSSRAPVGLPADGYVHCSLITDHE